MVKRLALKREVGQASTTGLGFSPSYLRSDLAPMSFFRCFEDARECPDKDQFYSVKQV